MDTTPQTKITTHAKRNIWIILFCFLVIVVIVTTSVWYNQETAAGTKPTGQPESKKPAKDYSRSTTARRTSPRSPHKALTGIT